MHLGAMATGFFIVYGKEQLQIDGVTVGWLTAVLVTSQAVMNLLWGMIGDRRGYKIVLVGAALCMALAALNAWGAASVPGLAVTFVLLGAAQAGDVVSSLNIILEFCAPADRPTYIGLTNTLLAPVLTLAPILGGWLAGVLGFTPLFLIAATVAAVGCLLMATIVREPRRAGSQ
jgi:MFS family permease